MPLFHDLRREPLRRRYLDAWRKYREQRPLEPLEAEIAAVIADHPQYVEWLETAEEVVHAEFMPEGGRENPFLHLALHLAVREQAATNRPRGTARIHANLADRLGNAHAAEHAMMECLGETLWEAQRSGAAPDEEHYRQRLEQLAGRLRRTR